MADTSTDAGILQVLAKRLESQRLPRLLSIKEKVDRGETLTDYDIGYLEQVFEDAQELRPLMDRHPEWQSLSASVIHLYKQITEKALENEKAQGGSQ